jgi:hypothetical protein
MNDTTKITITATVCIAIGLLIGWLTYPETITKTINEDCPQQRGYYDNDPSTIACMKRGGVPIYSAWNGSLKECK